MVQHRISQIIILLTIILLLDQNKFNSQHGHGSSLFVSADRQRRQRNENERDITPTEVEEITDDKTIEDDPDELAKKAMMEEWDNHMSDFVPNDMLSVQLNPREEIVSRNDTFNI